MHVNQGKVPPRHRVSHHALFVPHLNVTPPQFSLLTSILATASSPQEREVMHWALVLSANKTHICTYWSCLQSTQGACECSELATPQRTYTPEVNHMHSYRQTNHMHSYSIVRSIV